MLEKIFVKMREASRRVALAPDSQRSEALRRLAQLVEENMDNILRANALDLSKMDAANPLYDRLQLTPERLRAIAADLRHVASLPAPDGEVVEERTLDNGIALRQVRVPFGVVGVIYEARPNVTYDVFSLCLKSGNACVLKGGHDAEESNRAAIALIHRALADVGLPVEACELLPSTHEATAEMLNAVGYIDVCIPRGGRRLIDFVRDNARVPVIETGAGVVHIYFDAAADLQMGTAIICNAKTRRVSVCNALDTLLIHRSRLSDLPAIVAPLLARGVTIHADPASLAALVGAPTQVPTMASQASPLASQACRGARMASCSPALLSSEAFGERIVAAVAEDADREWMSYNMGIFTVDSLDDALAHIAAHGSGHSESIITEDEAAARRFQTEVDASSVYVNLPTSFTDGGQFGLGAEVGISTQKLGPRGPMGLKALTTTKYLLTGRGQLRP